MRTFHFFVYILASRSRTLYVGMTNNLFQRVMEHRSEKTGSFTARYRITRLVYIEQYKYVDDAIEREKELKDWRRERKIALLEHDNPFWDDLAADWDAVQERMRQLAHDCLFPSLSLCGRHRHSEKQIPPLRYGMTV